MKHCWKKLKKKQINGKTYHINRSEGLVLLKCLHYTNTDLCKIYTDSMQSLSKFQWFFFSKIEKNHVKIHMVFQRTHNSRLILRGKNKATGLKFPCLKAYYKAIVIKPWYWHKNRHINQQNSRESRNKT